MRYGDKKFNEKERQEAMLGESMLPAKPLGPVREIKLTDPRKDELQRINEYVAENGDGEPLPGLTKMTQKEARRILNSIRLYRDTIKLALLKFVMDENLEADTRIRAARAAAEFIPKETRVEVVQEELNEQDQMIVAKRGARQQLAAAMHALIESPPQ